MRKFSKPDLVIFDFDGTLVRAEREHFEKEFLRVLTEHGSEHPETQEFNEAFGRGELDSLLSKLLGPDGFVRFWSSFRDESIPNSTLLIDPA